MKVFVLKSFPLAANGLVAVELKSGTTTDVPDELVNGLVAAGLVTNDAEVAAEYQRNAGVTLENGALDGAPEQKGDEPVEIPEDWADLPWPELKSLAAKISETPITDKDSALDAINGELAARGQAPAGD